MKDKVINGIEFIGGKKIFLIIAGVVLGIFLIGGIVSTVSNSSNSSSTVQTTVDNNS